MIKKILIMWFGVGVGCIL